MPPRSATAGKCPATAAAKATDQLRLTGNLGAVTGWRGLKSLLKVVSGKGTEILAATHSAGLAARMQRRVTLRQGCCISSLGGGGAAGDVMRMLSVDRQGSISMRGKQVESCCDQQSVMRGCCSLRCFQHHLTFLYLPLCSLAGKVASRIRDTVT